MAEVLCKNGHPNPEGATYCSVCHVYIDAAAAPEPPPPPPPPPEPEPPPPPPEPEPPPPEPEPPPPEPEPPPPEPEPPPPEPEPPPPEVPPPPPPEPVPPPQVEAPMVTLAGAALSAPVGGRVSAVVELANVGQVDDEYGVEINGPSALHAFADPGRLALAAGAVGSVRLAFGPIDSTAAGTALPFEVRVGSRELPEQPVMLQGSVTVEPDLPPPAPVTPAPPSVPAEPVREYTRYRRGRVRGLPAWLLLLAAGAILFFAARIARDDGEIELADDLQVAATLMLVIGVIGLVIAFAVSRIRRR